MKIIRKFKNIIIGNRNIIYMSLGLLLAIIALVDLPKIITQVIVMSFSRVGWTDLLVFQSEYFWSMALRPFVFRMIGFISLFTYGLSIAFYHPRSIATVEKYIQNDKAINFCAVLLTPFLFWLTPSESQK